MTPCADLREDLALLAGGDLGRDDERGLRRHVEACGSCQQLLVALQADQAALGRLEAVASVEVEGLAPFVMARVITESHEQAVARQLAAGPRDSASRGFPGRVLAVVGAATAATVLVAAGLLALSTVPGSSDSLRGTSSQLAAGEGSRDAAPELFRPTERVQSTQASLAPEMALRQVAGKGLELTWAGDGRERRGDGARTYRVLASSDPRDFKDARALEVAGRQIVTDLPLPAARAADRQVTFFRIE